MSLDTQDESGDHGGHHLPAVEDWPRGFGEASWWPFVSALGAAGVYVAAGLLVLSRGEEPLVGPVVGGVALAGSVLLFLAGLYGWLYHAFVVNFWDGDPDHHGSRRLRFAMVLFLGSEVATFGAGFVYYFFVRAGEWPFGDLPHLVSSLVLANTAILVLSSFTMHFAHVSLRNENHRRFRRLLAATLFLGLVFIAGQAYEYYEFIVGEGFTVTGGAYASAFYGLTGLHGLHVSLGAVLLGIVLHRALGGQFSADRHTAVSTVSMYWHFVDAVWIFLVVSLYLGAAV